MSEFVIHPSREALEHAVARACVWAIERAIERRGHALAALAGGSTPAAILPRLFAARLPWERVTLTVSDDRQVPHNDPLSNFGQLARLAAGTAAAGARLVPLEALTSSQTLTSPRPRAGAVLPSTTAGQGSTIPEQVRDDASNVDLLWAGVGEDGHTLSWFPGPDLETAYTSSAPIIPVRPHPLPTNAPVPRWTLTLAAARAAPTILLAATGASKRAILENPGDHPVARLLALPQTVVHVSD